MNSGRPKGRHVSKTFVIPVELAEEAQKRIESDPEMTWAQYVRGLIRRDLEIVKAGA
jgi:hypothetical protein